MKSWIMKYRISFCFGWWDWWRGAPFVLSELPGWMTDMFMDITYEEIIMLFQTEKSLFYFLASKVRFPLLWADKLHMHVGWWYRGGLHGCQTLVSLNGQKLYLLWWIGEWCSMSWTFTNFALWILHVCWVLMYFESQFLFLVLMLYVVFPALTWLNTEVSGTDKTIRCESLKQFNMSSFSASD